MVGGRRHTAALRYSEGGAGLMPSERDGTWTVPPVRHQRLEHQREQPAPDMSQPEEEQTPARPAEGNSGGRRRIRMATPATELLAALASQGSNEQGGTRAARRRHERPPMTKAGSTPGFSARFRLLHSVADSRRAWPPCGYLRRSSAPRRTAPEAHPPRRPDPSGSTATPAPPRPGRDAGVEADPADAPERGSAPVMRLSNSPRQSPS